MFFLVWMQRGMHILYSCTFIVVYIGCSLVFVKAGQIVPNSEEITALHNKLRKSLAKGDRPISNMEEMTWDPELAKEAADIWTHCNKITSPLFRASSQSNNGYPAKGINRALAWPNISNLLYLVNAWWAQMKFFDYEYQACKPGTTCRHFMQIASSTTNRLGCAFATGCSWAGHDVAYYVCLYASGYSDVQPLHSYGTPCSRCPSNSGFCDDGLCVPSCSETSNCTCEKNCSKNGTVMGDLDINTCSCKCHYGQGPNCDENCENKQLYIDYDICSTFTEEDCQNPDLDIQNMLAEFCPAVCSCKEFPSSFLS